MIKTGRSGAREWTIIDFASIPIAGIEMIGRFSHRAPQPSFPHESFPNHLKIVYCAGGEQSYWIDGSERLLRGSEVMIIYPGEEHSTCRTDEGRSRLYWMLLSSARCDRSLGLDTGARIVDRIADRTAPRQFAASREVRRAFERLFTVETNCDSGSPREDDWSIVLLQHAIVECLLSMIRCREQGQIRHATGTILRVAEMVRRDPAYPHSLSTLASAAALSVPQFHRRFKEEMGSAPKDFVNRERIRQARRMLAETSRSVTSIALDLGFSSSQYFSTVFRRYAGCSPEQHRRNAGR